MKPIMAPGQPNPANMQPANSQGTAAPLRKALARMVQDSQMTRMSVPAKQPVTKPMDDSSMLPQMELSQKDFPGVAQWKNGQTVQLAVTATVKGVKKEVIPGKGPSNLMQATLEISSVK